MQTLHSINSKHCLFHSLVVAVVAVFVLHVSPAHSNTSADTPLNSNNKHYLFHFQ